MKHSQTIIKYNITVEKVLTNVELFIVFEFPKKLDFFKVDKKMLTYPGFSYITF